jgi:predicted deacylase
MSGSAVDVAACYPYGQDAFEKLLQTTNGRYQQDVIGVSQGGRPLVRLANDYGEAGAERVGIYVIARQHAHEVTGGWVLDGILRELADSGNRAPLVWAVPFAHIDGVVEGDYGKDSNPVDLNRAWGGRSDRHEIRVIRGDIERWRKRCRAALLLDLHSPTWSHGAGVFAFIANRHAQPAKHERCVFWTTAMEAAMGRYSRNPILAPESVRQRPGLSDAAARDRVTTAASYANNALDIAGVTLETPYGAIKGQILQRHDLMEIGRRVGRAIVDQARQLPA